MQGHKSVFDYTSEFLQLFTCDNLVETKNQQVSRYLNGLKSSLRKRIGLQRIDMVDKAHNMAQRCYSRCWENQIIVIELFLILHMLLLWKEKHHKTHPHTSIQTKDASNTGFSSIKKTTKTPNMEVSKNPYVSDATQRCYRCGKPGNKSNQCATRKLVNLAKQEDECGC